MLGCWCGFVFDKGVRGKEVKTNTYFKFNNLFIYFFDEWMKSVDD